MSLYNMMCGMNPAAGFLLDMIGLEPSTIPRFRDVWIDDDFKTITVHTRTGGGNRESYQDENDAMTENPNYVCDHDDSFDSTFADFVFTVPQAKADELRKILEEASEGDEEKKANGMTNLTTTAREKFSAVMEGMKQ